MSLIKRKLAPQEVLFKEGTIPSSFFILVSGALSLYNERSGRAIEAGRLSGHALIGDLLFASPRTLKQSARAVSEVEVLEVPFEHVKDELKKLPVWAQLLLRNFSAQLPMLERELSSFKGESTSVSGRIANEDILRGSACLRLALMSLPAEDGGWRWEKIREYAVQVFQIPSLRFEPVIRSFAGNGWLQIDEQNGELIRLSKPQLEAMAEFEDFLRRCKHSRSRQGAVAMTPHDLIAIKALCAAAETATANQRGNTEVDLSSALAAARQLPGGENLRASHFDLLIERGVDLIKESSENGIRVSFNLSDAQRMGSFWTVLLSVNQVVTQAVNQAA